MLEHVELVDILIILVAIVLVAGISYFANKASTKQRSRVEFQKVLSASYADYVKAYDAARRKLSDNWDLIEIIHDMSPYNLGPAGLPAEITFDQAFDVVRKIRAARGGDIAVVLHTTGGFSFPSDMIAKALFQHKGRKVAFVPYTAMSGGTLIALATDEIFMGAAAALGPIDTQYWGLPVSAYKYLKQVKNVDHIEDRFLIMSHLAEKFEESAAARAKSRINQKHGPNVVEELMAGGRYHGDPISAEEARKIGIRVADKECPKEAYSLVDARLRMLAIEAEQVVRRSWELQSTQKSEKSQRW